MNNKTVSEVIRETELAMANIINHSNLDPSILDLITRNINLQLQNIIANERIKILSQEVHSENLESEVIDSEEE